MKIKKALLLAGMALAVMAFAMPAGASANWLNNHKPIEADQRVDFEGALQFESLGTGVTCAVEGTITAEAGTTTGTIEPGDIAFGSGNECVHFGFIYQECEVTEVIPENLPWTVHVETEDPEDPDSAFLVVTDGAVLGKGVSTPGKNCIATETTIEFAQAFFDPVGGNSTTVNQLAASGSGFATILAPNKIGPLAATLSDTISLVEEDTWGFE